MHACTWASGSGLLVSDAHLYFIRTAVLAQKPDELPQVDDHSSNSVGRHLARPAVAPAAQLFQRGVVGCRVLQHRASLALQPRRPCGQTVSLRRPRLRIPAQPRSQVADVVRCGDIQVPATQSTDEMHRQVYRLVCSGVSQQLGNEQRRRTLSWRRAAPRWEHTARRSWPARQKAHESAARARPRPSTCHQCGFWTCR